jgi:hypothetical protein
LPRPDCQTTHPRDTPGGAPSGGGGGGGGGDGGDGGESSEYDSDYSEDRNPKDTPEQLRRRTRLKKSWKKYNEFNTPLVLNAIPDHASKVKVWKDHIRAEVVQCTKSGNKAFEWIMRVEDAKLDDDSFRVPAPKWTPLDAKIRAALLKDIKGGPISKMIALKTEEERIQNKRQIAGGYILRLIYRYYQMTNSLSQYYDFGDIVKVTYRGDPHLADFYHRWNTTLNGLLHPGQLHIEVKRDMFLKQLLKSTMMKFDLDMYARLPDMDPDKSYEWLCRRVEDRLKDERTKIVEQQLGYGEHFVTPALVGAGEVCRFHYAGHCNRGDSCTMSHVIPAGYVPPDKGKGKGKDDKGKGKGKEDKGKGQGKEDKGKGKGKEDKGKGKGKEDKGKGKGKDDKGKGKGTGMGGNKDATTPCFRYNEGGCWTVNCPHKHRWMTKEEWATKEGYDNTRTPKRPKSPGAAAIGDCAEWARGNCALGTSCTQKHEPSNAPTASAKAKAKAKARAAAAAAGQ